MPLLLWVEHICPLCIHSLYSINPMIKLFFIKFLYLTKFMNCSNQTSFHLVLFFFLIPIPSIMRTSFHYFYYLVELEHMYNLFLSFSTAWWSFYLLLFAIEVHTDFAGRSLILYTMAIDMECCILILIWSSGFSIK